jgi:hypothetical protein
VQGDVVASPRPPEFRKMPKLFNWMSGLKDTRKVVELCLPGSHDAGVYLDKDKNVTPGNTTRCQYENIGKQADCGSRVFDIRCFLRTTGLINPTKTPTMGHFFKEGKDGFLGDYGGTLESALDDAITFLKSFPTEFLIFRIGHTECLEEVAEVLETFYSKTDDKGKMSNANLFYRGAKGNLADLEVRHLRGKLVILCDEEIKSSHFQPGDGYCLYDKYSSTSPSASAQVIRFCGRYTGDIKSAAKMFKEDKGNWSPEGAVKNAEEACKEHKTHPSDHLFWVYWQETGGNVLKNTSAAQGMHPRLDNFLSRIRDQKNNLPLPNVIGHDFVDKFTCGAIVKMNMDVSTQLETYGF